MNVLDVPLQANLLSFINDKETVRVLQSCKYFYKLLYSQYQFKGEYSAETIAKLENYTVPPHIKLCYIPSLTDFNLLFALRSITLVKLTFDAFFNSSVNFTLSPAFSKVTHITFGRAFNCSVVQLPRSLTHLSFDSDEHFNHSTDFSTTTCIYDTCDLT
jgi:hypothetical protein